MTRGTTWRLIDTGPLPGAENMAIDEALLACYDPVKSLPVLRLYGWAPPAFSCGRFQRAGDTVSLEKCSTAGVQVVRRITGGGVLYHSNELTYSLICPTEFIPGGKSVKDAFFYLTSFLLAFYGKLGLPALYADNCIGDATMLGRRSALCFDGIERCDILINGKKIGGNAQRRLKNVIFQHGSIPIIKMAEDSLQYLLAPAPQIVTSTTSLAEEEVIVERNSLAANLTASFMDTYGLTLQRENLTSQELEYVTAYIQKPE